LWFLFPFCSNKGENGKLEGNRSVSKGGENRKKRDVWKKWRGGVRKRKREEEQRRKRGG